jgi:iron complex outermembrane recepter protein
MRATETYRRRGDSNGRFADAALGCCVAAVLLLALAAAAQTQAPESDEAAGAGLAAEAEASGADKPDAAAADATAQPAAEEDDQATEADAEETTATKGTADRPAAPGVEEIRVEAEAYSGTPRDAPISTVGFDMDTLTKEGIKDIRDLSNFTPSLEIKSAFAAANATIFIRGVGLDDYNANAAGAVAIYQDGVYMQSAVGQLFQFFDVEGIDVLRGPQGALYRSASAGAILVRSQKPTDEFQAKATATYGTFNQIDVESAVSGPIVPDLLSGRLAGSWSVRDGITKNRCVSQPDKSPCNRSPLQPGMKDYTNNVDNYAARAQLLFRPPSYDGEWLLNVHGGQNFSRAYQYQHRGIKFNNTGNSEDTLFPQLPIDPPKGDAQGYKDRDNNPFAGDYNIDGPELLDLLGSNLKGTWRFGDSYDLESLTAYEWHNRYTLENTDASPNRPLTSIYTDTAWQVSQELKLRGEWAPTTLGDGNWILGAYYIQEDLNVDNFYDDGTSADVDLHQLYTQKMKNFAAYGQSEYTLQPGCVTISCDLKLTTGLRYSVEDKNFDIFVCAPRAAASDKFALNDCLESLAGTESGLWSGLSGEATLAWLFQENQNVYIKYSRGWKGGHFNGGATGPFDVITAVRPEIVDSYEVGLRTLWRDDSISINTQGFYYDYQDLQVFQLQQTPLGYPISKLVNASSATVYGIELDVRASPLPDLNITFNGAWVESVYNKFVVDLPFQLKASKKPGPQPPPINFTRQFDYSGNPLIASPRLSMTGTIDYKILLPGSIGERGLGYITPRFSFTWKDDVYFDAGRGTGAQLNFPEATFGQKAYWVLNGGLTWTSPNERYEISGWVHNFLNEYYKTQSYDLSRGYALTTDVYADPRTFGVTVNLSF